MFNVNRCTSIPSTLATEKLKSNGMVNTEEVVEQLKLDFFNKCYLCEETYITKIEVDHLKPHYNSQDIDRKFDWNNLFFSCGHCNGTKGSRDLPLLDCTNSIHMVYDWISYEITYAPKLKIEIKSIYQSVEVEHTVTLLNEIFSGKNPTKKSTRVMEAGNLCEKIKKEIWGFENLLTSYLSDTTDICYIQEELSRKSPFSAFKRQIIKNSQNQQINNLKQYFD